MDVLRDALREIAPPIVRKARGELSQVEFAATIGRSQQNISDWEQGEFPPKEIPLLAKFAGLRVSEMLHRIASICERLEPLPVTARPTKHPAE